MNYGAVILAGGEGRRIGGNKPGQLLAAKPLIDHVLARVADWRIPTAVAIGVDMQTPELPGLVALRDEAALGPIAGIASALGWAKDEGFDAVLTVPCDTPFLPGDLLKRLANALVPPARAAVAASGGRVHPSCGVWLTQSLADLQDYLVTDRSLLGFALALNAATAEWRVGSCDPFFNVNTLEDLALAGEMFRNR